MRLALQEKVGVPRTDASLAGRLSTGGSGGVVSMVMVRSRLQAPFSALALIARTRQYFRPSVRAGFAVYVRSKAVCGLFDRSNEGSHVVDLDLIGDAVWRSIPGEIRGGICREECSRRRDEHRSDGDQRQDGDRAVCTPGAPVAGGIAGADMPVESAEVHDGRLVSDSRLVCGAVLRAGEIRIIIVLELVGICGGAGSPREGRCSAHRDAIGWQAEHRRQRRSGIDGDGARAGSRLPVRRGC